MLDLRHDSQSKFISATIMEIMAVNLGEHCTKILLRFAATSRQKTRIVNFITPQLASIKGDE